MPDTFQFVSLENTNKNDRIILKDNKLNAFRNSRKTILFSMICYHSYNKIKTKVKCIMFLIVPNHNLSVPRHPCEICWRYKCLWVHSQRCSFSENPSSSRVITLSRSRDFCWISSIQIVHPSFTSRYPDAWLYGRSLRFQFSVIVSFMTRHIFVPQYDHERKI